MFSDGRFFSQGCGEEKDWSLFPEHTSKNGLPQKTCQECQNSTKAERRDQIASGEREVGQGMAFHTPIVDGKKQCRQCEVWKPNDSGHFMTRAATGGLFHECKDCRRENARKYCQATWNAVMRLRRQTDENRTGSESQCISSQGLHSYTRSEISSQIGSDTSDEFGCTGKRDCMPGFRVSVRYPGMDLVRITATAYVWTFDHIIALDRFDMN